MRVQHVVHVLVAFVECQPNPTFPSRSSLRLPKCSNTWDGGGVALWQGDDDFEFKGNGVVFEGLSHVNGVGVRCLVDHGLSHEVVSDFSHGQDRLRENVCL